MAEKKIGEEKNLVNFADRELKMAGLDQPDSDYAGGLYDCVMELIKVFADQGHTGFSAMRTIQLFTRLARYKPLLPLTGSDEEWEQVQDNLYQNKRDSAVFKEHKDALAYYLDAIVWREENGSCFTGTVEGITSHQYIKFPFTPKTFYIDVISKEVSEGNWIFKIKDREQFKEVLKYYTYLGIPPVEA